MTLPKEIEDAIERFEAAVNRVEVTKNFISIWTQRRAKKELSSARAALRTIIAAAIATQREE